MKLIRSLPYCMVKPLKVGSRPVHLQIEITSRCNQNCKMCMRRKGLEDLGLGDMSFENYKKILDKIKPAKVSLIGFGEPLLHNQIFDFIKETKKRSISVQMTSNFVLLDEDKIKELIFSGLDTIKVSLETPDKTSYKEIRGVDDFDKVIDNVKKFIELKKRHNLKKPFLRFTSVVQADNINQISDMIKLTNELGVKTIYFKPVTIACLEDHKKYLFLEEDLNKVLEELNKANELGNKLGILTNLNGFIGEIKENLSGYRSGEYHQKKVCLVPWFSCYICYDGTVRLCGDCYSKNTNLGNMFEQDFDKIWNNEMIKGFRKEIKDEKNPLDVCKTCTNLVTFERLLKRSKFLPGFI